MVIIAGGMVNAANVWTSATRTLDNYSTKVTKVAPADGASVAVTSGVNNAYGNWFELIAASATAKLPLYLVIMDHSADVTGEFLSIELGTGAAASEVVLTSCMLPGTIDSGSIYYYIVWIPPRAVATNTRIAVRASNTKAAAWTFDCYLVYADATEDLSQV